MNHLRALGLACAFATAFVAPARAQRVSVEALADVEAWKTDAGSRLLARNDGEFMAVAHVHGFGLLRLTSIAELRAVAEASAGTAQDEDAAVDLELLSLKVSPSRSVSFEAGKVLMPLGGFGIRRFANTNPLIGEPDLYPTQYPWGIIAAGGLGKFDYSAGAVSLPVVNPNYSPEPSDRLRPIVRVGFAPSEAFRISVGATHGPYLGSSSNTQLPANAEWQDYDQTIVASDVRFSIGYVSLRGEIAWSRYEVPTIAEPVKGLGAYGEVMVAHTPRIFSAARVERFKYPFIRGNSPTVWIGNPVVQYNAEVGVGYRLSRSALAKVSYRRDYWPGEVRPGAPPAPDGYALAAQLSMLLDFGELLERRY